MGRVDVESDAVEYLELPMQALREPGQPEQLLWSEEQLPADREVSKKQKGVINYVSFRANELKNSRGVVVMGDDRSTGNGWGPQRLGDSHRDWRTSLPADHERRG